MSLIQQILDKGVFDSFIGVRENEFLEAKLHAPFDMTLGHATNIKLAKYGASFANHKGGYIMCGLKTARASDALHDQVIELDLSRKEDFYPDQELIGRIAQSTHPKVSAVVRWYPYANNPDLGMGVIYVSPRSESDRWFHIRINKIEGVASELFAVPVRGDGFTDWKSVNELYAASKAGPNNIREAYDGLTEQLQELGSLIASRSDAPTDSLDEKIKWL